MPENNPNTQATKPFRFKEAFLTRLSLWFLYNLNKVLIFFSLRQSRQFWGIVYDSWSKQPLDPVIVKLLYADGREIDTGVTDLAGRYGFLARPGKFKIFVRKTNYLFPSRYAPGGKDGVYENLYHGEFFTLNDEYEVVAPNIPMDPEKFDWNQQAKQKLIKTHPYLKLLFSRLVMVLFWFGFMLLGLYLWRDYPHIPRYLYVASAAYLTILFFASVLPEMRLWGQLEFKRQGLGPDQWLLELENPQFPNINFGRATTRSDGKFLLRANPGKYILTISRGIKSGEKIAFGTLKVKIDGTGVLNSTIIVK